MRAALPAGLAAVALATLAYGHHIMGVPHYAYDEAYPQAPVVTYAVQAGPYVVKVTGYPGRPAPFERAEIHAYLQTADEREIYSGPIEASVRRTGLLGQEVVWGPNPALFDDNLHKFTPSFGEAGQYHIRLELDLEGQPYEIDFPIAVGEPGHPGRTLLAWLGGVAVLVVCLRAARIKLERRRRAEASAC